MIEVRELLIKAFASAWRVRESALQTTDRDSYIQSSITVIDTLQVSPEMIYAEEGPGLTDGEELDHLDDLVRADGVWVYYGVPEESFFLVTWMEGRGGRAAESQRPAGAGRLRGLRWSI